MARPIRTGIHPELRKFMDEQKSSFEKKYGAKISMVKFQQIKILPELKNAMITIQFRRTDARKKR